MSMIDSRKYVVHASFVGEGDLLRPASILDLFQDEASIHANMLHLGYDDLFKKDMLWVVNYQEIDIVGKLPKYCDEVIVSTWPHRKNRLEYVREYDIKDLNGNLLVSGIASWFTIKASTRRLVKDDSVDFGDDYYENTNYPEFRRKRFELEPMGEVIKWDYKVTYTDLDHNVHMNNAKYLDMVYNMQVYPGNKEYKHVEIEFVHEAKLGEVVTIKHYKEGIYDCYVGFLESEVCFEVRMEMTK